MVQNGAPMDDSPEADGVWALPGAGEKLADRFMVERVVCQGGMGAILRGVDLSNGDAVAIKFMSSGTRSARARFVRESALLAELTHPGIVRHLSHGTTPSGLLYLVMEWLAGEDLAARLTRGRLTEIESLAIVRQVAEALETAHVRGVVHRDLKPANLFLVHGSPHAVKVLDFGVARLGESVVSGASRGSFVGTFGYMAPEQVMCERDVDARADVFAMGCVLYECLTGSAPFASGHPVGVLAKVLREEPRPPSEVSPGVHTRVDELVGAMLAKNRRGRPADAAAVLALLDALGQPSRPSRRPERTTTAISPQSEKRVVSVILGRPSSVDGTRAVDLTAEEVFERLSAKFAVEVAPLQGGALVLVMTGRGYANDRASQAALCALDLMRSRPDLTLAIATGLADTSGEVPFGAAIDRAAELLKRSTSTAPGIRVDDVTMGLIGLRFEVQRADDVSILVRPRPHFEAPRLLMGRPTPCVGRDREIGMLDAVLDEVVDDGVSRAVLVTGAAGIGKSRLAAEWLARGRRAGDVRALFARADPRSASSPLSLMHQLLRDSVSLREADQAEKQRARLGEYLSRHGAELGPERSEFIAEILGVQTDDEPSQMLRAARSSPEIMQERVVWTLGAWLDVEVATQPLVLVLEDFHWGDKRSVAFLTTALRESPELPVMILALARPDVERQFPEFTEQVAVRIRLQGLTARASQELVQSTLEGSASEEVASSIIRTADGNPFYLEELIRRVASGGTEWPDTVLAMAQSRIEELDADARCALRAASIFGERAWDLGVQEMLGSELDARAILAALARGEILMECAESRYKGSREYRFRHALLRDAAYAMTTESDRQASHGVAAEWLERNHEHDGRVLADHFEAAALTERARPWLVRAARAAIDAGDITATIELAERGVRLGATGIERGRFLLARGYAEAQRGSPDLKVAREALDLLSVGTAPWWLGLATLVYGSTMQGTPEEAAPYAVLAQHAPFTRQGDVPFGQGLVTLVGGLVLLGKSDIAELVVERVAASCPEPDPVFEAFLSSARCALASVAPIAGKWRLELAYFGGRRAVELLRKLGVVGGESVALYYFAAAAIHLGCYEEARKAAELSLELTRRASASLNDGWPSLLLARALLRLGKPEEALETVAALQSSPNRIVRHMLPVVIAEARFQTGDVAAAIAEAEPACAGLSPRLRRLAACILARAQLSQGSPEAALATVESGLGKQTSQGLETDIDLLALRAEALFASGRGAEASEAIVFANDFVTSVAREIVDDALRTSFLRNVEPCARVVALHRLWVAAG